MTRKRKPIDPTAALTQRQLQVAGLAGTGMSNQQIAVRLGITEGVVKNHLRFAFQRLGVKNRVQLTLLLQAAAP
jgi:DNA-binding CsgD family transcriptional regulator